MAGNASDRPGDTQDRGTNRSRRQVLKAAGIAAAACVVPTTSVSAATNVAAGSLPKPQDVPRTQKGRTYRSELYNINDDLASTKVHSSTLSWHGIQDLGDAKEHIFTLETCAMDYDHGNGVRKATEASHFWLETDFHSRQEFGNDFTIVPYPNTQYQQLFPGDSSSGNAVPDMIEVPFDYLVGLTNPVVGAALVADDIKQAMEPHDNMSEYWEPSYGWKGSNPIGGTLGTPGGHVQRFHVEVPDGVNDYTAGATIYSETKHWYPPNDHWFESVFHVYFSDSGMEPDIYQSYNKYGDNPDEIANTTWER